MNPAALRAASAGDLANLLVAATPGGIERQEAQGQRDFVAGEAFPREIMGATREQLAGLGFVFGADVDDLFVQCRLPNGWKKIATDHSMWSAIVDDKGRKRGGVFYKAAFYDRRADAQFDRRYSQSTYLNGSSEDMRRAVVLDGDTVIHDGGEVGTRDFEARDRVEAELVAWLDEKYPDWRNPLAYWD